MSRKSRTLLLLLVGVVLLMPTVAEACSTCFGDPEAPMSKGLNRAVWFLVGVVGVVQAGIVKVMWNIRRRGKRINDPTELRMPRGGKN